MSILSILLSLREEYEDSDDKSILYYELISNARELDKFFFNPYILCEFILYINNDFLP